MCGWFNSPLDSLTDQINAFHANLANNHDHYPAPVTRQQSDAMAANVDQCEGYRSRSARALTQQNRCDVDAIDRCDICIPIDRGNDAHAVWRPPSTTDDGINKTSQK